jgi:hypothetical protein
MLHLVAPDAMTMGTLCSVCLHEDTMLEYSNGGAFTSKICLFNHAHFNLVKRYDQCRDFTDMNQREASDADTDIPEQFSGAACDSDHRPGASAAD